MSNESLTTEFGDQIQQITAQLEAIENAIGDLIALKPPIERIAAALVKFADACAGGESASLKQIAKACRDLRRNANLDDSPDLLAFLEEIETQLEDLELS